MIHQKDEAFRSFALSAHPLRLLLVVCGPLAIYQAFQQIFTILDTMMVSNVSSGVISLLALIPVLRKIRRLEEDRGGEETNQTQQEEATCS